MARERAINSVPDAAPGGAERETIDHEQQLQRAKDQLCTLADRGIPMLIESVARTAGTEGATVTFTATYKSGGASSKQRIEITASVKTPLGGFSDEVAISIGEDGAENQMRMFVD